MAPTILITGASGNYGSTVIKTLLAKGIPGSSIAAATRSGSLPDLSAQSVTVHKADFEDSDSYKPILQGIKTFLIIPGQKGDRPAQHKALIELAKEAGVQHLLYVSAIKADSGTALLCQDHYNSEKIVIAAGIPYSILRSGWYTENISAQSQRFVDHGAIPNATQGSKWSLASRFDMAEAAAIILADENKPRNKIWSLAGDQAVTIADFAEIVAKVSGKPVKDANMDEASYRAFLVKAGLPDILAHAISDAEANGGPHGDYFDDSGELSQLLGRPAKTVEESVRSALKA